MKLRWQTALILFSILLALSAAAAANDPAVIVKETAAQMESDWVDSRWQQMDVGTFLASNLQTPAGWVAKGISVRVGEKGEASVCYDTGSPMMRAVFDSF